MCANVKVANHDAVPSVNPNSEEVEDGCAFGTLGISFAGDASAILLVIVGKEFWPCKLEK